MKHNFSLKVVSVTVASILWVLVLGSRGVEVTKEVALEVVTPPELVVSSPVPDRVLFRLSGPKAFLRTVLSRRDEPIRIQLQGMRPGVANHRFFSDTIRVPLGVKVVGITPPSVALTIERRVEKKVRVRAELVGDLPSGFRVKSASIRPIDIIVSGAESRIERTEEVQAAPINLASVRESGDQTLALELSSLGLRLVGDVPKIHLEIEHGPSLGRNRKIKGE